MRQSEGTTASARPGSESTSVQTKQVYGGGAVDYDPEGHESGWLHSLSSWAFATNLPIDIYCPKCSNAMQTVDEAIMARNLEALMESPLALFRLDGTFTVGTPIEISIRVARRPAGVALWVDPGLTGGLFVRGFVRDGALLLTDREEVTAWLRVASR